MIAPGVFLSKDFLSKDMFTDKITLYLKNKKYENSIS